MMMGKRVSFSKSDKGMDVALNAPNGLMVCNGSGVSPSGKTKPLPGS